MDRLTRFAPLSGLATAVLFAVGNVIWGFSQPAAGANPPEIVSFYEDNSGEIIAGATLSMIAMFFFIWFGALLRERLREAEGGDATGLPLAAFGGAIVASAVGLGAETINMAGALRAADGELTPDTAQIYFDISCAFGYPSAGVALAVIAAATALVALRTGAVLPRWLAWLTLVLAVALLTPAVRLVVSLGVLLLGVISVALYRERSAAV